MAQASARREALAARVAQAPAGIRGGKDHYARKAAKVARTARILRERVADEHRVEKPWQETTIDGLSFERVARSGDLVLVAERLQKSYGMRTLFRDLSFHLRRGGRLVIRGANGSGKTTLLNITGGALQPDAGIRALRRERGTGHQRRIWTRSMRTYRPSRSAARIPARAPKWRWLASSTAALISSCWMSPPLEQALQLYPGAVVAISRDPCFIEALGEDATFMDL